MKTIKELEELLGNEDLKKYEDMVDNYLDKLSKNGVDISPKMLAALLLIPNGNSKIKEDNVKFKAKKDVEYQRFFITIGSKDKVGKLDIVDFLKSHVEGLSTSDFADVYILDVYSFFEVDSSKKEEILSKNEGTTFKNRSIHLEFSEARKKENKPKSNYVEKNNKKYYK